MRGVNNFQIWLVIDIPYLRHEGFVGLDDATDLFFETANDHGIGHDEWERMVKLHILVNIFEMSIFKKDTSTGVMALKSGHI